MKTPGWVAALDPLGFPLEDIRDVLTLPPTSWLRRTWRSGRPALEVDFLRIFGSMYWGSKEIDVLLLLLFFLKRPCLKLPGT